MANRLKVLLLQVISEQQSAFVLNHLITDNALVALETFYYIKRDRPRKDGAFALKLDMSKAYNKIE